MKRLSLFLAAMLFAVCSFAQLSIWNGSADLWTKGAGTQTSPFQIESAEQLAFIAEMVNAGVTTYENTYFKLMTNIDLNNLTWVPIGASETNCFKGHLDGNNKTIFNNSHSLFQFCNGASVEKLSVEISGFAVYAENCEFKEVSYKGDKTMIDSIKNSTCYSCHVNVVLNAELYCGGIATKAIGSTFQHCSMNGTVNANFVSYPSGMYYNYYAAGIVAISHHCRYIGCSCYGTITAYGGSTYHNTASYYSAAGGIVASSMLDSIQYCSMLGISLSSYPYTYDRWGIGGIVGVVTNYTDRNSYIKNSFTTNNDSICGITGYFDFSALYEKDEYFGERWNKWQSYFTGTPIISNSYSHFDKTAAAMKSVSFPIILNTDSTVFIKDNYGVNDGYPIYKNQVYPVTTVADNIGFTSAQLNGNLYVENADSIGFEYKEKADATHWYRSITATTSNTPVSHTISDLTTGTEYVFRIWVEKEGVRYFGDTVSFTTLECSDEVTSISATICNGEEYFWADQTLTQAAPYRDTLTSSLGCDSIVELTLIVLPTNDLNKYDTIPIGETYDFYGEILDETGIYYHYVPAGTYCNLIILHLQVGESEGQQTAIDNIEDRTTLPRKLLQEGQIYILRGEKSYTTTGAEVK